MHALFFARDCARLERGARTLGFAGPGTASSVGRLWNAIGASGERMLWCARRAGGGAR